MAIADQSGHHLEDFLPRPFARKSVAHVESISANFESFLLATALHKVKFFQRDEQSQRSDFVESRSTADFAERHGARCFPDLQQQGQPLGKGG